MIRDRIETTSRKISRTIPVRDVRSPCDPHSPVSTYDAKEEKINFESQIEGGGNKFSFKYVRNKIIKNKR